MILITGANGQLGTELRYLLDERGVEYVAAREMDITDADKVDAFLQKLSQALFTTVQPIQLLIWQKMKAKNSTTRLT